MTAASIIAEAFGEDALSDLYGAVLSVPADATASQLRKAYHKLALRYHPDKVRGGGGDDDVEVTKLKFQAVSAAYQILSDDERRREYDETGELVDEDEEGGFGSGRDGVSQWTDYFASIFGKVTFDDIDNFSAKYKGSDEEEADVLRYYKSCKGNLNKMVDCVMCSEASDKKRWVRDILEPAIARGDVPRYDALERTLGQEEEEDEEDESDDSDYDDDHKVDHSDEDTVTEEDEEITKEKPKKGKKLGPRKKKKAPSKEKTSKRGGAAKAPAPQQKKGRKKMSRKEREAKEAEELIAKIRGKQGGSSGTSSLAMRREEAFNGLISNLESRYSGGGKKSKKKKRSKLPPDDIPDDEFERIQASLNANKQKNRKKS